MAQRLFALALAPTTLQSYTSAFQRYQLFCLHASLHPFPVSEHNLVLFCTHLSIHVAAKTIKSYLSGVRFHSVALGHYFDVTSMPRLYYVLRGIKRSQGNSHRLPLRQPITMAHLRQLLSWLQTSTLPSQDRHLWWTACTLAFFGLLRTSEYTAPTTHSIIATSTLAASDIRFNAISLPCWFSSKLPRLTRLGLAVPFISVPLATSFVQSTLCGFSYVLAPLLLLYLCLFLLMVVS